MSLVFPRLFFNKTSHLVSHPARILFLSRSLSTSNPPNPLTLHRNDRTIHLLGTMHIAQASATAARSLILREHTKHTLAAVFLELDSSRFQRLKTRTSGQTPDQSLLSLALSILSKPTASPLASLFELGITAMYRALHRLGFASGVEFTAAIEISEELRVPIVLGDQHISTTMAKVAEGFKKDFQLPRLLSLAFAQAGRGGGETKVERGMREAFEAMAKGDVERGQKLLELLIDRESVKEIMVPLREAVPAVAEALVDQRDLVMVDNLIRAVDDVAPGKSLVAVVGLAHVEGIEKEWRKRNAFVSSGVVESR